MSASNVWYGGQVFDANGTTSNDHSVDLDVPAGTGYTVYVFYRASSTAGWSIYGSAAGTVDVGGGS